LTAFGAQQKFMSVLGGFRFLPHRGHSATQANYAVSAPVSRRLCSAAQMHKPIF
jgi:hypothetical protein